MLERIKGLFVKKGAGEASQQMPVAGAPYGLGIPGSNGHFLQALLGVDGVRVTPDRANGLPTVAFCVDKISSFVASPSHRIQEQTANGKITAMDHDQYDLISRRPNHRMTQVLYAKTLVAFMLLWGNGLARLVRNKNGRPVEYRIWHPGVTEIKLFEGVMWYKNHRTGEVVHEGDMIDICDTVRDPYTYRGKSRIALAYDVFKESLTYKAFSQKFIENGTHLGYAVTYPGGVKQEQIDKVEAVLNSKKKGIHNGGDNLILGGAPEITKLGLPLKDAQLLETLEKHNTDIGLIFGFKPGQVGQQKGESFNSLEQYNIEFLQYPILPIAKIYMQEHTHKLMRTSSKGRFCMDIDFTDLMKGSVKDRTELYRSIRPALTLNQILEREGYNTFEGGDVRIADLNTTTLDQLKRIEPKPGRTEDKIKELIAEAINANLNQES